MCSAASKLSWCSRACGIGRGRWQLLANKVFDALPDVLIAFDFNMASHENACVPRILLAGDGIGGVVHAEVAENLSARCIGSLDFLLATDKPFVLVEICGQANVIGNDGVVLTRTSRRYRPGW